MKRILFALIILSGIIRINAQTLIPSPEQLIIAEGYFELDDTPIRIYVQDKRLVPMSLLRTEVLENADIQTISRPNKADIRLQIEKGIPAEGYRLSITSNYMEIKAADKAGFVYAFQTLRQLREKNKNLWKNVSISDRPRTKWRGYKENRTFDLRDAYTRNPSYQATQESNPLIWGMTCALWTDDGVTESMIDQRLFPRILALTEQMWHYGELAPFEVFHQRVNEMKAWFEGEGYSYGQAFTTTP